MNKNSNYLKNTFIIGIGKIIENIISFLIIIILTKYLGAKGLGQYSFIFAIVSIFFIFNDFGLSIFMIREISKKFSLIDKIFNNILQFKLIILIITFIIYLISLKFINKNEIIIGLIFAGLIQIIRNISDLFYNILKVKEKSYLISVLLTFEKIINLIWAVIFIIYLKNLNYFIVGMSLTSIISLIIISINTKKYIKYKSKLDIKEIKHYISISFPFILTGIFATIYIQIDSIMLSFLYSDKVVGWYNSGYKLINTILIIPITFLTFGFPKLSYLYSRNILKFEKLLNNIIFYNLILIIPITIGGLILSDRIIEFIFHFQSAEASNSFKILLIVQIFIFLNLIYNNLYNSINKQIQFSKIAGFGATINIILNLILIPKYSLYGAGVATLITYIIIFILSNMYIKKIKIKINFINKIKILIIPSILLILSINILINYNLLIIIIISGIVYLIPILIYFLKNENLF